MTESKTIKVSKETYAELSQIAGELQIKLKRPVSLDDAIKHLTMKRKKGTKISDLAGLWKDMTDEEAAQMEAAIDESWKKWKLPK
jgi:predicted CopG family antitoxin